MKTNGYLIVLDTVTYNKGTLNILYRGVDRLPQYPSNILSEREANEFYVFSGVRLDSGLIETLNQATDLLKMFEKSPRKYEILFCSFDDDQKQYEQEGHLLFLGVDVASISGDCWSIVKDYPCHQEMKKYLPLLNENGLFSNCIVARKYLMDYRSQKLNDYDFPFEVIAVYRFNVK